MSETIWKCILAVTQEQELELPQDAEILSIQQKDLYLFLWYRFSKSQRKLETKTIKIIYTGDDIPSKEHGRYLATVQMSNLGPYANLELHIFEMVKA